MMISQIKINWRVVFRGFGSDDKENITVAYVLCFGGKSWRMQFDGSVMLLNSEEQFEVKDLGHHET